jgi:hypothetical protein
MRWPTSGLAAFSVFFMQSPSFLAHQQGLARERGRSNCETLFAMTAILKSDGYHLEHNFGHGKNDVRPARQPQPAGLRHAQRLRLIESL